MPRVINSPAETCSRPEARSTVLPGDSSWKFTHPAAPSEAVRESGTVPGARFSLRYYQSVSGAGRDCSENTPQDRTAGTCRRQVRNSAANEGSDVPPARPYCFHALGRLSPDSFTASHGRGTDCAGVLTRTSESRHQAAAQVPRGQMNKLQTAASRPRLVHAGPEGLAVLRRPRSETPG